MAWAPDGTNRLFVSLKNGTVRIVRFDGTVVPTPFATETVFTNSECGLIGMAFDPSFASNGYLYLFFTASSSEQRIVRYTAVGDVGTARTQLVTGLPTAGNNHDGGAVGIGWDGKLYWGIGDLGNGTGVNTDLTSLAAKIGRANRDGTLPPGNPFADGPGGNNDFIWARGVRNPFTFTFQPTTGALWLNDVGTSYEQIFIVGRGDHAGYSNYENNQPDGFISPVIKYRTNSNDSRSIAATGAVRTGGTVTFTTTSTHRFRRGERITIAGVTNTSFNGAVYVASTPSATTFTAAQTGADASSGGGSATTASLGGCVTGGCFFDTSAVPAAYHGNFFFGDLNSGNLVRAQLDGANNVNRVDVFATGFNMAIDTAIGPDGRLWGIQYDGRIVRWTYTPAGQEVIVSPSNLRTDEGGATAFSVRLAQAPAANVTVAIARSGGDSDLSIDAGASLTFTPANWATPQPVRLAAAEDSDAIDDAATFAVSSAGLTTQNVALTVLDNDAPAFVLSGSSLALTEGASTTLTVALSGPPPGGTANVTAARTAGDADITISGGAALTFTTANYATPQTVTVAAAEDSDQIDDTATISITATGFATQTVSVTAKDNDASTLSITSTPVLTAVAGNPYAYNVDTTGTPEGTFTLDAAPTGMTINASTGLIAWIPAAPGSANVTVRVSNGVSPAVTQSFTITVAADTPPTVVLTRPYAGEIVSGTGAEWFGDGHDDVATVKGEFFVDGVLVYTDNAGGEHYHCGGTHFSWNTTTLANGAHTLRFTVTDTGGQTASTQVNVIVANGISAWQAWLLAKFTPAEQGDSAVSGEDADFDGDGLTTLLEFALGGDPKRSDVRQVEPIIGEDAGYLTLTYTRTLNAPNLTYTVEASTDLVAWSPAGVVTLSVVPEGARERVTVRDAVLGSSSARRFLRLNVTRTP
jgi:glucose/arabinose dehydrogenase